jgi:hypothetical protein
MQHPQAMVLQLEEVLIAGELFSRLAARRQPQPFLGILLDFFQQRRHAA